MTGAGDGRPGGGTPEDDRPGADGEDGGERGERIARFLARAGIASRRAAETLIAEGRVKLGGRVVETPATFVSPGDAVSVDGRAVAAPEHTRLFRHHKPDGLVTTHKDPQGRPTVFEKLPAGLPRLISVGRLDLNSEGLLLLTNDGALARKLELPSNGWIRRYRARVHGRVDEAALAWLAKGITVEGVKYGPIQAGLDSRQGTNAWLTVSLQEGKNREVRRVLAHLGLQVTRLIRTAYGPFQLGSLPRGAVEEVNAKTMRDQLGLDVAPRIPRGRELAAQAADAAPEAEKRRRPPRARRAGDPYLNPWGTGRRRGES
ncbi:Ribosomal large subunit pseudouridine synthase B [Roseomonas mucosa]|uniref:pseudouridine synthase n=1 Tax=Roseomonas TaxID=125216 RepID=UPI0009624AA6|nr:MULTISPECIES: pseudouridine synthase [Roseomonas]MDT8265512.1 pseudouridine synthase [Roseomonas sp. DSM 102946]ATR21581.1 rRNA pseudouridine synthase [Roseomonas sp. FDAARGOS_362]QDJ08689.1 Ribosomal large subunit pseudouridine synthase B [Roseomonas mucosa]UZO96022.1 Ribosomal large subunit pseudouridine synthase B [Roseomonas mucosa]GAV36456.1 ribosomal large subunit pseudouridine synthase B [Roseomonas sp. TAS13]